MPQYRRAQIDGGWYFFTVCLRDRRQSWLTDRIDVLRQATARTKQKHPLQIHAAVVLPEHLHAIWKLPEGDHDFSTRWRLIKSGFTRGMTGTPRSISHVRKQENPYVEAKKQSATSFRRSVPALNDAAATRKQSTERRNPSARSSKQRSEARKYEAEGAPHITEGCIPPAHWCAASPTLAASTPSTHVSRRTVKCGARHRSMLKRRLPGIVGHSAGKVDGGLRRFLYVVDRKFSGRVRRNALELCVASPLPFLPFYSPHARENPLMTPETPFGQHRPRSTLFVAWIRRCLRRRLWPQTARMSLLKSHQPVVDLPPKRAHLRPTWSGRLWRAFASMRRRAAAVGLLAGLAPLGVAAQSKEFTNLVGNSWDNPVNWVPVFVPQTGDFVSISTGDVAELSDVGTAFLRGLRIENGGELRTNGGSLTVDLGQGSSSALSDTVIDGVGSVLRVDAGGTLIFGLPLPAVSVDSLTVENGGLLEMRGGTLFSDARMRVNPAGAVFGFEAPGAITGYGTIGVRSQFRSSNKIAFNNSGLVRAEGGDLTIFVRDDSNRAEIKLGTSDALWEVVDGSSVLTIDGRLERFAFNQTFFNGQMRIGGGNRLHISSFWDAGGDIEFVAGPGTGVLSGGVYTHEGDFLVNGNGRVESVVEFESDGDLLVAAGQTFTFADRVTYRGGDLVGGANSVFNPGIFTVEEPTVFDFTGGTVDLDAGGTITLNESLTVRADRVESTLADGVDGVINIASGKRLDIDGTGGWTLDGQIAYAGGASSSAFLAGDGVEVAPSGRIDVAGQGTVAVPLTLNGLLAGAAGSGVTFTNQVDLSQSGSLIAPDGRVRLNGAVFSSSGGDYLADQTDVDASTVEISGGSFLAGRTRVGADTTASVTGRNGVDARSRDLRLGELSGGDGTLWVRDAGTVWDNDGGLYVGDAGTGTVTVSDGGGVSTFDAFIAEQAGSNGTVTVTDAGSSWTSTDNMKVGVRGVGTLNIEDGGEVTSFDSFLGDNAGSTGTVNVTGANSSWTMTGANRVGDDGTGVLNILDGGRVTSNRGFVGIRGTTTSTATVSGAGSTWTNNDNLFVGFQGGSGNLTVENGGRVTSAGTTTIEPGGAISLMNGTLNTASFNNAGGTFNFLSGTFGLSGDDLTIGVGGQFGPLLTIFTGQTYEVTQTTVIESSGTLTLDGGTLRTGTLNNAAGGTFNFTAGTLEVDGGVFAPNAGGGYVVDGGVFAQPPLLVLANGASADLGGALTVGDANRAEVRVIQNASLTTTDSFIGGGAGSNGVVEVDGHGSLWNARTLIAGLVGTGELTIGTDARVNADFGILGEVNAGPGASASGTVNVNGGALVVAEDLLVGNNAAGTLNIDGGGVTSRRGLIAVAGGSTGSVSVGGEGGSWAVDALYVGGNDVGAGGVGSLTIEQSGGVSVGDALFDAFQGSLQVSHRDALGTPGGALVVYGDGTILINGQGIVGAGAGESGTLNVEGGGRVSNGGSTIGSGSGSTGVATVSGVGSTWESSLDLNVGLFGTASLNVEDGAAVTARSIVIANENSSTGSVTVSGPGSNLTTTDPANGILFVGLRGDGTLNVRDGGAIEVAGALFFEPFGGSATLNVTLASTADPLIDVGEDAILAGDLSVDFVAGFTPSVGDVFTLIDAGRSVNGTFDNVTLPSAAGLAFDLVYETQAVLLEVLAGGLVGDYNDSGTVEQGDLDLVLNNWGQARPFDPNGDAFASASVDQEELDRVLNNWGSSNTPEFQGFTVPEPGLLSFGIFAACVGLKRRR